MNKEIHREKERERERELVVYVYERRERANGTYKEWKKIQRIKVGDTE